MAQKTFNIGESLCNFIRPAQKKVVNTKKTMRKSPFKYFTWVLLT